MKGVRTIMEPKEERDILPLSHFQWETRDEQGRATADQFVEIHEMPTPVDGETQVIREDERYQEMNEDENFPVERPVDPLLPRPRI